MTHATNTPSSQIEGKKMHKNPSNSITEQLLEDITALLADSHSLDDIQQNILDVIMYQIFSQQHDQHEKVATYIKKENLEHTAQDIREKIWKIIHSLLQKNAYYKKQCQLAQQEIQQKNAHQEQHIKGLLQEEKQYQTLQEEKQKQEKIQAQKIQSLERENEDLTQSNTILRDNNSILKNNNRILKDRISTLTCPLKSFPNLIPTDQASLHEVFQKYKQQLQFSWRELGKAWSKPWKTKQQRIVGDVRMSIRFWGCIPNAATYRALIQNKDLTNAALEKDLQYFGGQVYRITDPEKGANINRFILEKLRSRSLTPEEMGIFVTTPGAIFLENPFSQLGEK